jgi:cytoskeletal protein RodZ
MAADRTSSSFGGRLREARERRGITLRQLANATKISVAALEALERNDISRLPGGLFSRAFVRAYAAEVGLDPEETTRDFMAQFPQDSITVGHPVSGTGDDNQAIESDRKIAATVLRLVLVTIPIAAVVVYFGRTGTGVRAPIEPSGTAATAGSAEGAAARPQPPPAEIPTPAPVPTAPPPRPADPPGEAAPQADRLLVGLSTTARCWVSAIADGQRVIGREMGPGEQQVVEVKRDLILSVGDAGAITTTFNGAPGRPLGKPGEVVTVQMNLKSFQKFVATP